MENTIIIHVSLEDLRALIVDAVSEQIKQLVKKPKENLLSRNEAAEFLRISPQMLYKMTRIGEVPAHRLGDRVLYKESELLDSLKKIQTAIGLIQRERKRL